jgi:hypothetical protein
VYFLDIKEKFEEVWSGQIIFTMFQNPFGENIADPIERKFCEEIDQMFGDVEFSLIPLSSLETEETQADQTSVEKREKVYSGSDDDSNRSTDLDSTEFKIEQVPHRSDEPSDSQIISSLKSQLLTAFKRCERRHKDDARTDVMRTSLCRAAAKALNVLFNTRFKK